MAAFERLGVGLGTVPEDDERVEPDAARAEVFARLEGGAPTV